MILKIQEGVMCYRSILPFLIIFGSFTVSYADSVVQTDWSGGPGVFGPVVELSDEFYLDTDVRWSIPGDIVLHFVTEHHTVAGAFDGAYSVYSEDIDGDGDMDILGAACWDNDITWWENEDGSGTSWIEHTIDGNFVYATSVYSADIDSDGDMDILGAAYNASHIIWWENEDGSGTSWIEHTVDGYYLWAFCVYSEDIDGDGDMDILSSGDEIADITWWENIDGLGINWAEHPVAMDFDLAHSVYSEDIDGDGDMDILGAANLVNYIAWWENIDGSGINWTEHVIGGADGAYSVYSADIDSDGDMDVLGAARYADDIIWWENTDGSGSSWTEHTVDGEFNGALCVYSEDIDGDGDMDILGAAFGDYDITWWENIGGSGTSWVEHTVDGEFINAHFVYSEDIDGDGNMDILGAAYSQDNITWWDLNQYSPGGSLESSVLYLQNDPGWGNIDWTSIEPTGTAVAFQVRASDTFTDMGTWSDTLLSPCSLEWILNDYDSYFQYRAILATSNPDTTPTLNDVTISWNPLGIGETAEPIPPGTELLPISPNPSSGSPIIRFALTETANVDIYIFDFSGRLVSEIHEDEYSIGFHEVLLVDLYAGIYFCRMTSGDFTATQRFVVIE